jgi:hypothetical protein
MASPRALLRAAVGGGRRRLQQHFAERDKAPNRLNGRRTHFWGQVRSSTQIGEVTDTQGSIVIGDGRFKQKLFGGKIVAKTPWKNGFRLLNIPVDPRAHGLRPSSFEAQTGLKLFFMGNSGGGVLATRSEDQGIEVERFSWDDEVDVIYASVPEVNQKKDPEALPPDGEIAKAAIDAGNSYVNTVIQESQSKPKQP